MNGAAFLLVALAVGLVGSLVVVVRNRQRNHPEDAMAAFRREMEALAPTPNPSVDIRPPAHPPGQHPFLGDPDDGADDSDPIRRGPRPDADSGAR